MPRLIMATIVLGFLANGHAHAASPSCEPFYLAGRAVPEAVQGWICADPLMLAQARAVVKLQADQRRSDEAQALGDENDLRLRLEGCGDARCVRIAYEDRLQMIVENAPFPLRGGASVHADDGARRVDLWSRDLADGWRLYRFEIAWTRSGRSAAEVEAGYGVFQGMEMFVARPEGARTIYRRPDGSGGYDIDVLPDERWKVVQVGDCVCGPHLNYDGVYGRRGGKAR